MDSQAKRTLAGLLNSAPNGLGLLGTQPRNALSELAARGQAQGPYGPMGGGPMMSEQERNLYQHHLYNLDNLDQGGGFTQPNGDVSTVLQMVVGPIRGKYYNIPSVWGGKQLDQDAAMRQAFYGYGLDYWPSYATPQEADARYMNYLHPIMDRDMQRRRARGK